MSNIIEIGVKLLNEGAVMPFYAKEGDAGFDLVVCEDTLIGPGQTVAVKTGLAFEIPVGHEIQVRPRSGISLKGVDCTIFKVDTKSVFEYLYREQREIDFTLTDAKVEVRVQFGTVDSGYKGEVGIITKNVSEHYIVIPTGTRLAQGVLSEKPKAGFKKTEVLSESDRGAGGFGHTGTKL